MMIRLYTCKSLNKMYSHGKYSINIYFLLTSVDPSANNIFSTIKTRVVLIIKLLVEKNQF